MKIWYQAFQDFDSVPGYEEALTEHAIALVGDSAEISLNGLPKETFAGTSPAAMAKHLYTAGLVTNAVIDAAKRAYDAEYDAFALGNIQNPGLKEIRSLFDLPATSYGEAALYLACQLGRRIALMAFNHDLFPLLEDQVQLAGLSGRIADYTRLNMEYDDAANGLQKPGPVIDSFTASAREAIARGADVLIPGQVILGEVLWQNGITEIDGAPVVDPFGAAITNAIQLATLRRASGITPNRRGYFGAPPPPALLAAARRQFLAQP